MTKIKLCFEEAITVDEEHTDPLIKDHEELHCHYSNLEGLEVAEESLRTLLGLKEVIKDKELSIETIKLSEIVIKSSMRSVNESFSNNKLSLESISLTDKKSIVLESISEVISKIWDKIIATFKYIINNIINFFSRSKDNKEKVKADEAISNVKEKASKSPDKKDKQEVDLTNFIRFLKTHKNDEVLTTKTILDILHHYDDSLKTLDSILHAIHEDITAIDPDNLKSRIENVSDNPDAALLGDRASLIYSKIFKESKVYKAFDSHQDKVPHEIKALIAKENSDLDINGIKVIYDGHVGRVLVAKKIFWDGTYIKDVYSYKPITVTFQETFNYSNIEAVSLEDAIKIMESIRDSVSYKDSLIEDMIKVAETLDTDITKLNTRVKETDLSETVKNFVIPYILSFKTCSTQIMTAGNDITKNLSSFRKLLIAMDHRLQ